MRKMIAVCGNCSKEVTISDNVVLPTRAGELLELMPSNWRKVSIDFGNQGGKAESEVCSFECSIAWIDKQREAQYTQWQHNLVLHS